MKILVIEDESTLNKNISEALSAENFLVESAFDGYLAERFLKKDDFDCVIMDINLPQKNGYDLCKEFREYNTHTPVLMLTAFDELDDKIKGFDSGADDYLTKPFYMKELIMRINSLIKRSQNQMYNKAQTLIKVWENTGEIVSKKELIHEIWRTSLNVNTNTIEVYINFLRNKIDKPFGKNSIQTKIGYGYFFKTNE